MKNEYGLPNWYLEVWQKICTLQFFDEQEKEFHSCSLIGYLSCLRDLGIISNENKWHFIKIASCAKKT